MTSPSSQSGHKRRSSRLIITSPLRSSRRSARLSIISQPAKVSSVKVCIRPRPLNKKERSFREGKEILEVVDENNLVFDPVEVIAPSFHRGLPTRDPTARRCRDVKFKFGRVFGPEATNQEVFEETTKETLDNLMKGINCSVFAYGATGAGKTYTMLGTPNDPGVIARTVNALYERIQSIQDHTICEVEVSYLEIYNETVRDLLNPTGKELILRENGNMGVVVTGLSFHKPSNVHELFEMLDKGNSNRTQHPTDANKESSRSHAVFHIYLKQRNRTADISTDVKMSKMALIDLAGSERAAATANCGMRFREGANINKSLLALGNCINALAEGKASFVAFRGSKLTRILKDSLGGNCQTVMIAAVSVSAMSFDDTYNTLRYADRAQKIKLDLKSNIYRVDQSHEHSKIIEELQAEIRQLRMKVDSLQSDKRRLERELDNGIKNAYPQEMKRESSCGILSGKKVVELYNVMAQYTRMQERALELSSQRYILEMKLNQRELSFGQLCDLKQDIDQKVRNRFERFCVSSRARLEQLMGQVCHLGEGLRAMKTDVEEVFGSVSTKRNTNGQNDLNGDSDGNNIIVDAIIEKSETCQWKANAQYLKEVVICVTSRVDQQDRVIESMGSLLKRYHLLLTSYNHLTPSDVQRFEAVEKLLVGSKEVRWGDQNEHLSNSVSMTVELPNYSFGNLGMQGFAVQRPVKELSTMNSNGAGEASASASTGNHLAYSDGSRLIRDLQPQIQFSSYASSAALSGNDDISPDPISTPSYHAFPDLPSTATKPKGTPARPCAFSSNSASDESDASSDHPADNANSTFTLQCAKESPVESVRLVDAIPSDPAGTNADIAKKDRLGKASNGLPKFTIGPSEIGRPSLPAMRSQPKVVAKEAEVDKDGFKKPPVPNRLTKPKTDKTTAATTSTTPQLEKTGNGEKPKMTTAKASPLLRSPSQSSLSTGSKKTPDLPHNGGSGLRRQAASSSNLQAKWRF